MKEPVQQLPVSPHNARIYGMMIQKIVAEIWGRQKTMRDPADPRAGYNPFSSRP